MATIVLTAVGAGVGSIVPGAGTFIGGALGAALGSYIDSQYLYPALFPPPTTRIGKIKDLPTQQLSEGAGANYCYGSKNRVDGTVIWLSPLIEKKRDSGKGGPGAKIVRYKYFFDVAVVIADRPNGPINKVQKIFADGKIIYNDDPAVTVTSSSLSINFFSVKVFSSANIKTGQVVDTFRNLIEITCLKSVFDLTKFKAGRKLIISGSQFNDTDEDGRKIRSVRDNGDGTATVKLLAGTTSKSEAAGNPNLTLLQNFEKFDVARFDGITFYNGTTTQTADPIIESYEGAGNVPGYRGTAYVVLQNLSIEYYGNRLPQFQFEVDSSPTESVGSVVSDTLLRAGLKAEEFDVSALVGDLVAGYNYVAPQTARDILDPLLLSEDVFTRESNNKLQFFKRESASKLTLATADLAATENGDEAVGRPVDVQEIDATKLPSEIVVSYIDTDKDLQKGSQSDNRQKPIRKSIRVIELPVAMTASKAKDIATRVLWRTLRNSQTVRVLLPPSYLVIEEGDIVTFTAFGQTYDAIVSQVTFGRNGVIDIEAVIDDIIGVNASATDLPAGGKVNVDVKNPTEISFARADIAALRDAQFGIPGFYFGAGAADPLSTWKGAAIYVSTDGADFRLLTSLELPATIGESTVTTTQLETIVDNETTPGATFVGPWRLRTDGDEPYGGSHRTCDVAGSLFHWDFSVVAGTYEVFARWTAGASRSAKALYSVAYIGNTAQVRVNQGDSFFFDQWVSLGRWVFSGSHRVTLTAQDDGVVCADAVRIFAVTTANKLGTGEAGYWDLANSVTVRLTSGSLESRSIEEVLGGLNFALLGDEVIAFRTATLVSANTYILSKLLRGLRGTEMAIVGHKAGESFMLLDDSVSYLQVNAGDIGKKTFFKIVAAGNVVEDAEVFSYRTPASTVAPLPVAKLRAQVLSSDAALQLDWFYRSGKITRVFNTSRTDIEDLTGFEIDVVDASGEVKRTVAPWLFTSWGGGQDGFYYTSSEQIADGFSTGQTITFKVYQISETYGRGKPATVSAVSTI